MRANRLAGRAFLTLTFLFLYLPILSIVVYSFNESKLVTVWSGFSFKWYAALADDTELTQAAWLSLKIATATAFASVFIGTWIGFVLARYRRFSGKTLFTGMVNAPLVLPEVIQAMSLLLLFVALQKTTGWPAGRGIFTIWVGHVMLCVSYVAITVQARLAGMNQAFTEAAQDLGATPMKVFIDITLPLISQALVSGWLLSFTISLDNVVMSAFLSGPGSTVLPLVVFSRVRLGLNPEIHAMGTIFIVVVTIVVVVNNIFMQRRVRRRDLEIKKALSPS
jgi:putrescine transport system permease protein